LRPYIFYNERALIYIDILISYFEILERVLYYLPRIILKKVALLLINFSQGIVTLLHFNNDTQISNVPNISILRI